MPGCTPLRSQNLKRVALALAAALIVPVSFAAEPTDFGGYRPHFQGFGVKTRGGRGGTVYKVTNLNDSGPGSLRAALVPAVCTPRYVVFEVSGTIQTSSIMSVTCPYLTIAGQTAPSPGILGGGRALQIDTHDVVIQHLRWRIGDIYTKGSQINLFIRNNAFNIVLDHVSLAWGTDETLSFNAGSGPEPQDISVLDSIISETLDNADGGVPNHSRAISTGPSPNGTMTFARNLLAHHDTRNPSIRAGWQWAMVNNVIYNYRGNVGGTNHGGTTYSCFMVNGFRDAGGAPIDAVHIRNLAIPGPDTPANHKTIKFTGGTSVCPGSKLYLEGNTGYGITGATGDAQWSGVHLEDTTEVSIRKNTPSSWYTAFNFFELESADVEAYVLANAGARPRDRDADDARVVQDVKMKTGRIIDGLRDLGPYPVLAQNRRTLTVPANPHAVVDAAGRTRIEAWLESFARALEPSTPQGSPGTTTSPPANLRIVP